MNRYAGIPTAALAEMWSAERERLSHQARVSPDELSALLSMRTELDRRAGDGRPVVDADFAKDYLTD